MRILEGEQYVAGNDHGEFLTVVPRRSCAAPAPGRERDHDRIDLVQGMRSTQYLDRRLRPSACQFSTLIGADDDRSRPCVLFLGKELTTLV